MAPQLPTLATLHLSINTSITVQQSSSATKTAFGYHANATGSPTLLLTSDESNSNLQALLFNILTVLLGFAAVILAYLQLRRFVNERFGMDLPILDRGLAR